MSSYIGKVPTAVPLTSSDITDGIISVAKLTSTLDLSSNTVTLPSGVGGKVLQVVTQAVTQTTGTTQIPQDNTLPQSTEGTEVATLNITPASTSNKILVTVNFQFSNNTNAIYQQSAIFRGTTCIDMHSETIQYNNAGLVMSHFIYDQPNSTSQQTYSIRVGRSGGGTWQVGSVYNNNYGTPTGGNRITLMEIAG